VRALQYDGGFVAALLLDLRLRQRTDGSRSLDDLMREMFARYGTTGKEYALADVSSLAEALAGDDLDGFFERYVAAPSSSPSRRTSLRQASRPRSTSERER
jgi:predicted metalloprotease with PDZ domain